MVNKSFVELSLSTTTKMLEQCKVISASTIFFPLHLNLDLLFTTAQNIHKYSQIMVLLKSMVNYMLGSTTQFHCYVLNTR